MSEASKMPGEILTIINCTNILLLNTGSVNDLGVFDIILANINLGVIRTNIVSLKQIHHNN